MVQSRWHSDRCLCARTDEHVTYIIFHLFSVVQYNLTLFRPGYLKMSKDLLNFSALCRVGLKFVFPHNFFIAITSEIFFLSTIEQCVNPRPAIMTGVKKMSLGLFFFFA